MAKRYDSVVERLMLTLFSNGYNYRRFVRDRTRSFLYDANERGLYLDGVEAGDDEVRMQRLGAVMHGFCAGYVTGVDGKYDEDERDMDVSDELFDVMAFAQTGVDFSGLRPFVAPRAHTFLVGMLGPNGDAAEHGAMVGSYMLGLSAGVDDVESGALDDLFCEGGAYFAEQEVCCERIFDGLSLLVDCCIDSDMAPLSQAQALCRAVAEVACIDAGELFSKAMGVVSSEVERRLERAIVGRSGFGVRNERDMVALKSAMMFQAAVDELFKSLVGASGCNPEGARRILGSPMASDVVRAAMAESYESGLFGEMDDLVMCYASCIDLVTSRPIVSEEDRMSVRMAMPEAVGRLLGRLCAREVDPGLSESERREAIAIFEG